MTVILRVALALLPLGACSGGEQAAQPEKQAAKAAAPTATAERRAQLMDAIESRLVMPDGAAPLRAYRRSYAFSQGPGQGGDAVGEGRVVGVFDRMAAPGRQWVEEEQLPRLFDGGCSLVTIVYDPATATIEGIGCNGEA